MASAAGEVGANCAGGGGRASRMRARKGSSRACDTSSATTSTRPDVRPRAPSPPAGRGTQPRHHSSRKRPPSSPDPSPSKVDSSCLFGSSGVCFRARSAVRRSRVGFLRPGPSSRLVRRTSRFSERPNSGLYTEKENANTRQGNPAVQVARRPVGGHRNPPIQTAKPKQTERGQAPPANRPQVLEKGGSHVKQARGAGLT